MPEMIEVKVPWSIVRLYQMDDGSIRAIYQAEWLRSTRSYVLFRMTREGAKKLLLDACAAADGHWNGGSPQQNSGNIRAGLAFAPKLRALLAK